MAFDKIILKNLLKNFNSVPFTVQFWDDEVFTIGEGSPRSLKCLFVNQLIKKIY